MHESSYNEMKKFVEEHLDRSANLSILDIGSYDVNGTYKPLFNNNNWKYTGLDLQAGRNVDVVSTDPYKYPFDNEAFDVVISGSVLEHVYDTHAYIKEAARVLKKGGKLCVIAPWAYPEHDYPVDCWRILPAGMKYILKDVAGLNPVRVSKNETDCVGIAMKQGKIKHSFGVLVNDLTRLDMVFRQSEIEGNAHTIKNPDTAAKGLNKLLAIMEKDGSDIGILAHQDMYFRQGWLPQAKEQIAKLPESWIVAGIIGKDMKGAICGNAHDMRVALLFNTRNEHEFPQQASCFDECCIIVNLKKGFRFDEGLKGFDLYGTMAVCQAWEMGGTAWIIDAFAEHYCMRPFTWVPDDKFAAMFRWLHTRFPDAPRIDTTVLGVPREVSPARYDDVIDGKAG